MCVYIYKTCKTHGDLRVPLQYRFDLSICIYFGCCRCQIATADGGGSCPPPASNLLTWSGAPPRTDAFLYPACIAPAPRFMHTDDLHEKREGAAARRVIAPKPDVKRFHSFLPVSIYLLQRWVTRAGKLSTSRPQFRSLASIHRVKLIRAEWLGEKKFQIFPAPQLVCWDGQCRVVVFFAVA